MGGVSRAVRFSMSRALVPKERYACMIDESGLTRRDNRRGMADGPMRREWRRMTYRVTESCPFTFTLSEADHARVDVK
mgnify:CR=1 FL=1